MLDLFIKPNTIRYNSKVHSDIEYIRKTLSDNLKHVKMYYRDSRFIIPNNHFLNRLIKNTGLGIIANDMNSYLDEISLKTEPICKHFGITTPYNIGKFHNVFYGNNSYEIILNRNELSEDIWNLDWYTYNWRELAPVKIYTHQINDLNMLLPKGSYDFYTPSMSIISIDILMLNLQYKQWYNERVLLEENGVNIGDFIHKFVLPNALDSQLDYVVINKIRKKIIGLSEYKTIGSHPFALRSVYNKLDNVLDVLVKDISNTRLRFEEILFRMPSLTSDGTLWDKLIIGDYPNTMQIQWALFLTRLDIVELFINLSTKNSGNRYNLNRLLMLMDKMHHNKSLSNNIDPDISKMISNTLDNLYSYLKRSI